MKPFNFGHPVKGHESQWAVNALRQIELQSNITIETMADEYDVSNFTPTRTLNATTATAADVANFIATFIDDIKRRGSNRTD
jgi:hypothetical protein